MHPITDAVCFLPRHPSEHGRQQFANGRRARIQPALFVRPQSDPRAPEPRQDGRRCADAAPAEPVQCPAEQHVIPTLVRVSEGLGECRSVLGALRAGDAVAVDAMDLVPEPCGPSDQLIHLVVRVLPTIAGRHSGVNSYSHIVLPLRKNLQVHPRLLRAT